MGKSEFGRQTRERFEFENLKFKFLNLRVAARSIDRCIIDTVWYDELSK